MVGFGALFRIKREHAGADRSWSLGSLGSSFLRSNVSAFIDAADPIFHPIHLVPRWDRTSTYTMKQQQDRILIYDLSSSRAIGILYTLASSSSKDQAHPHIRLGSSKISLIFLKFSLTKLEIYAIILL